MTLKDWLDKEGKSIPQFAESISRTAETVRRYIIGDRIPDRATMPLIAAETGGEVTANDFFGISSSGQNSTVSGVTQESGQQC